MASHFHWRTVNSRPLTIPSGIVHALFPTTFIKTAVYNSIKLVFVLNNFPVNNLRLKANWQNFYEKKKKESRGAREGHMVSLFVIFGEPGKRNRARGQGVLDKYLGIGDPLRV